MDIEITNQRMNFILISEAAELTGLNRQTIRNWIDKGIIPAQKINGTYYVDRDTFITLSEKMQDVVSAERSLNALKEEYMKEKEMFRDMYDSVRTRHNVIRYLSVCINSGLRTRFFENIIHIMGNSGLLSDREARVLVEAIRGSDLTDIARDMNTTRERIRMVAEKAIRRSRILVVEQNTQDEEIKALKDEISVLKKMVYRKVVQATEGELTDAEKRLVRMGRAELVGLLSRELDDNAVFSCRTLNALRYFPRDGVYFGIKTLGELCRVKKEDFIKLRNVGKKTVNELTDYLAENGLTWGMNIDRVLELI